MINRRQFIQRLIALGLSGTGLAALDRVLAAPAPSKMRSVSQAADAAYLAVARGDDPETLVRRAIEALGGMGQFVKPGQSVIVKPNICVAYYGPEYAATTNPAVVAALVKMSVEAGAASVQVMDKPFGGPAKEAYVKSGIGAAVSAAGGEMVEMSAIKLRKTPIPEGQDITSWPVYQDSLEADVLINVPIAKHHSLARLTLGAKNLMGLVENRPSLHVNLGKRLPDLVTLFKPKLTVVDAYRILMRNGPSGGNLDDVKLTKAIIASADIVAADAYATSLFNLKPEDIPYIKVGAARGLGIADMSKIKIAEIDA